MEENASEGLDASETLDVGDSPSICVGLEYYLNDNEKKEGILNFGYSDEKIEKISYEEITYSFYSFMKYSLDNEIISGEYADVEFNNIKYEFIRYFDGKGWILLNEKEIIFFDDEFSSDILKIMIKATIICGDTKDIKKEYENIDKEIDYIYTEMFKEKADYSPPDAPLNLVVLTANPLMDGMKELRTMNDFNTIRTKIYNLLSEEDCLNYTEFGPLTKKTLKNIITDEEKRPVILHLICKSTYIIKEDNVINQDQPNLNNNDCTYLIFEKDFNSNAQISNYNCEFINKEKLENEIFNFGLYPELKENISKITLIISTPLAEDVYDIFKDFGFRNILVQHTTLADVKFVAEFNKTFYKSLITHLSQPINIIYEEALNIDINKKKSPIFCCCFHKHKKNCEFMKNIKNEIYNETESSKDLSKLEKIKQLIPHFYHLLPDCSFTEKCYEKINQYNSEIVNPKSKYPENSFSFHNLNCIEKFKELKKDKMVKIRYNKKAIRFYNICCCKEEPSKHNINFIFPKDFNNNTKNNQIRFRRTEIMKENKYFPKYEKMKLLVGKNNFVLDVLKFFFSDNQYLNIYGDNIENLKKFGSIVKEYYLERYHFYKYDKTDEEEEKFGKLKKNLSVQELVDDANMDKLFEDINLNENLNKTALSSPSLFTDKKVKEIAEIYLNKDNENMLREEQNLNFNIVYFIYVCDTNLVDKIIFRNYKTIIFSEEKLDKPNIKKIELTKELSLKTEKEYKSLVTPNEYIKFQNKTIVRNWRKN